MITPLDYALIFANILVYASIIGALAVRKKSQSAEPVSLEESFRILETSLNKAYPDLPEGYTWQEITSLLRSSIIGIGPEEWAQIENVLEKYQAFRYGGVDYQNVDPRSVLHLAKRLSGREMIAR